MADIEIKKLTDLTPDSQNANAGTERGLSMLEKSVRTRGAGRSILVDKQGRIIAGNKTHQTAIDTGLEDVIIVRTKGDKLVAVMREDLDLTDDETGAREMAYADNRVGEVDLSWSAEQVLADMQAGVDLSAFWSEGELSDLLAGLIEPETSGDTEPQIDRAAELAEEWGTEVGQVWQLGPHRLAVGDCTDKAVVALAIAPGEASLVVTDPPYGVSYADKNEWLNAIAPGNRIQTPIENDHGDKSDIQAVWKAAFCEMEKVMAPGAVVYCFMPQGGDQMMMMMMTMMGAGIEPRHELVWLKNNHVLGRVDYAYKHEPILYAWKDGGHKFYGDFQTSILEYDKPQKSDFHPTTKPVGLFERLISNSSKPGEIVYDPFVGSGTTIIAAHDLNRIARAIELDPGYAAVTLQRFKDHTGIEPELLNTLTT